MLDKSRLVEHWKARGLDFSKLFHKPEPWPGDAIYLSAGQDHGLEQVLDRQLIASAGEAIEHGKHVRLDMPIRNSDRTDRRHAVGRDRAPLRPCGPARRDDPHQVEGDGGPELRRLPRPGA